MSRFKERMEIKRQNYEEKEDIIATTITLALFPVAVVFVGMLLRG